MLKKLIDNLVSDFTGTAFYCLRSSRLKIYSLLSTMFNYLACGLRNIKVGKKCNFIGNTVFYRTPCSKMTIGDHCTFRSDFTSNLIGVNRRCIVSTLYKDAEILIGNSCGFSGTTISAAEKIVIGNNVLCGANVVITDFDWHLGRHASKPKPILIEDNVWLGLNTVVLKGVKIGKNSIIGAHSTVVKSIPENVMAAGNPCRVLKQIVV
jgi:acetyltransferase-like isoleucine patch superfamily enzyme